MYTIWEAVSVTHMKPLDQLVPLWYCNTPPVKPNENDYLLKITGNSMSGEEKYFFIIIQWCPYEQHYFAEPVEVDQEGKLTKSEALFNTHGLCLFTKQMNQLGIKDLR